MRRALILGVLVGMLATAAPAAAEFGPIELISKSATEQAKEAKNPAISAAGEYVAFQGAIGGQVGVFRKNLVTGALQPVAVGPELPEGLTEASASAPSISADGRYVAFTTLQRLDPANDPLVPGGKLPAEERSSDVYVADMSTSPPTYELASALDSPGAGCEAGVTEAGPGAPLGLTYATEKGSMAAGRTALSADGREVAFVVQAESNLTSGPSGSTPGVETPEGQVAVRDLATGCTTLVSAERDPESGGMTTLPVAGGAMATLGPQAGGASLSADGTTVAWLGIHIPAQAPALADEAAKMKEREGGLSPAQVYNEPLWRRIADGPTAPTRRVVGGGDPLAPGCPAAGSLSEVACQGPYPQLVEGPESGASRCSGSGEAGWDLLAFSSVDVVPQLSADGRTVALLGSPGGFTNVYLADMSAGLSRREALGQLTREVPDPRDPCTGNLTVQSVAARGDIVDLAISPDGERIALVTGRQQFPLAPPNLLGSPPSAVGLTELYLLDRETETLERLTGGPGGAPSLSGRSNLSAREIQGAGSPSFTADDRTIAFSSVASNLVSGDANGAGDVFTITDHPVHVERGSSAISPPPAGVSPPRRRWRISVSASSQPHGRVRLLVAVPGAGQLRARARELPVEGSGHAVRTLSRAHRRARAEGVVKLMLNPSPRARRLARRPGGVPAAVTLGFTSRGHQAVHATVQVRFVFRAPHGKGSR